MSYIIYLYFELRKLQFISGLYAVLHLLTLYFTSTFPLLSLYFTSPIHLPFIYSTGRRSRIVSIRVIHDSRLGNIPFPAWEYVVPSLGIRRSRLGNILFPAWAYVVPCLGTSAELGEELTKGILIQIVEPW